MLMFLKIPEIRVLFDQAASDKRQPIAPGPTKIVMVAHLVGIHAVLSQLLAQ